MATLVITVTTLDTAQAVKDIINAVPTTGTITTDNQSIQRAAAYVEGVANGTFSASAVTLAIS